MSSVRETILFDIDGTICPQLGGDNPNYEDLEPYPEAVDTINKLYDEGFKIVLHTSRFMGRCGGDVLSVYREGYHEFTRNQLEDWGVKFHELHMGKPRADLIVDDRAAFYENNWDRIYEICQNCRKS